MKFQFQILIDGKDTRVALPVKWNELLDERLDESRLSLRREQTKRYRIGAPVSIKVNDTQKDFIISADDSTEVPVGSGYYDHELSLIEPTKLLEGVVVESLTFTNTRAREYHIAEVQSVQQYNGAINGWVDVPYTECCKEIVNPMNDVYYTPNINLPALNTVIVKRDAGQPQANNTYEYDLNNAPSSISITKPNGEVVESIVLSSADSVIPFKFDVLGTYSITYTTFINRYYGNTPSSDQFAVQATIGVTYLGKGAEPTKKWTITSVINRVLSLCEPRMQDKSPRYKLDPAQVKQFEQIEAPEFAFTNKTLKEILDAIGGFIHGIPRLVRSSSGLLNTIHYDMLGGTEEALISSQNIRYITEIHSQNIEDYVTELDSTVDNLVNTLDSDEGAVTEPYAGGYKSVRSEELYARITDGNMVISTTLPIYTVQKLEVLSPEKGIEADITAYLFEGADYGRLSSFDGYYSMSKAYAIYYEQGQRDIKGLSYKSPSVIGGAGAEYSITNIIKAVTGDDIEATWWADTTDKDGNTKTGHYPELLFRVTYTPIFSARILQHKPYIEPGALKRALVYNQGANLVETRYYGENMRGAIARMGNPELTRTYRMPDLTCVPKIGQIFKYDGDDYYISSVIVAVYPESVDFTVGMSKDFNRLSQYIGINSEWRAYEVSEKQAFNRDLIYADYCVIGAGADAVNQGACLANKYGFNWIAKTFSQEFDFKDMETWEYVTPISLATVTTYEASGVDRTVSLPVVSVAMGNTLVFSFGMEDNWSAGPKSVPYSNGKVSGYWQTDVPYTDYYGRVDSLNFILSSGGKEIGVGDAAAFDLPQGNQSVSANRFVEFPKAVNLNVEKDSKEILKLSYQLRFVTTLENLIIGPALTRNCTLVRKVRPKHAAAVYVLPEELSKFAISIDTAKATKIYDYGKNPPKATSTLRLQLGANGENSLMPTTQSGKAWAIADQATGEILLAQNITVEAGGNINLPDISFAHTI